MNEFKFSGLNKIWSNRFLVLFILFLGCISLINIAYVWISILSSKIYGLEHLDRGYENFELKLKNLGVKIIREISKNTFEENRYKIEPKSENPSKLEAA